MAIYNPGIDTSINDVFKQADILMYEDKKERKTAQYKENRSWDGIDGAYKTHQLYIDEILVNLAI